MNQNGCNKHIILHPLKESVKTICISFGGMKKEDASRITTHLP